MSNQLVITGQVVEVGMSGDANLNIVILDRAGSSISIEGLTDDEARFFGRNFFSNVTVMVEGNKS